MGGVAGPMMHLYGDPSLTYNQIKKILSAASQGEIEGTEKTDGYNIYLGYVNGKPRAARNKGDMSKGGMDFGLLAAREFKGGPEVRKVYLDAFRAYGKALETLSDKELASIFGENGEIFYNTEIQGPSAEQLVNYDANVVSMHFVGHKIYNPETDALEVIDASANSAALDRVIDRFEETLQGESFSVRRTAALVLNRLSDDYDLNIALNKMQKAGFSGSMTIEEFLESKIMEYLDEKLGYFSDEVKQNAVDRILKKEGSLGIPQIAKGFPAAQRSVISTVIKYGPALKKKYIFPIEDAIHDFSVELLRGLQSAYILDNDAEVTRLKNEVAEAIKTIQAYTGPGAEEAHEMLYQQLKKLKHHGNINTAVEGFVFQIGDQVYKFTGNFAPANQLLGLFKYGRGKVPPMNTQNLNEAETHFNHPSHADVGPVTNEPSNPEDKKFLVLVPGGFKPPHLGHYNLVKSYLDHPSVERVAIVIGDLERTDTSGQVSIGFDEAVRTWKEYGITEGPNVTFVRARKRLNKQGQNYENPMADAYDIVQEIEPSELKEGNMVVALGASTKGGDYERAVKFAKSHQPGSRYYRDGLTVTEPPVKVRAEDYTYPAGSKHAGEPISATYMRDAIAQNDLEEFKYHMPPQILKSKSDKNLQNLLDSLAGTESYEKHEEPNYDEDTSATPPLNPSAIYNIAEGLDLYHLLEKVVEDDLDVETALEEISSMAGGDVEIGVGAGKRDKKKKKPTIFREEHDQVAVESMKEQVVDFLREKGPTSYNGMSHQLVPGSGIPGGRFHPDPALNTALRQLAAEHRVGDYYKSAYAGSIYYLVPEQQHMVPGADPQGSFLQENEGVEAMEGHIINYLEEHGPSRIRDMRRTLQALDTHPGGWVSAMANLKKTGRANFYYEPNGPTYWYLIPEHQHMVPGADPQMTWLEENEDIYDPEKYPEDMTEEDIVNYLQENGPSKEYDIYLSHFRQPPNASTRERALANINRFLRPAYALKESGRIDFHSAGEESPLDREYGHMGKFWYLVPEHQHLVPGSSGQVAMFEENGGISREQLGSLKMQIRYYLIAWGPKQDKDIIHYITKQARGAHWEHVSEDELRKAVFTSFSELKREGHLAWRREKGSHGTMTNWWYLLPNHAELLSTAGEQEEMFFQEDRGVRGKPGSNNPSTRDADDRTNEEDPETGKTGNVGPKYKIAREQSEVDEVVNYLLDVGVFTG